MPNIELNLSKKLFNDTFYPYLKQYDKKYEVYMGGAGSGKSYFVCQKLLIKALTYKRRVLIIRKTGVSLRESCWRLTTDILSKWNLLAYCKVNKSDLTIELPNGSFLLFKGLDDPEKIKSITGITDCWIEEATELNQEDFDQLTLRLREKIDNTQFFLSFNPVSKTNWVYTRWFAPEVEVPEDTFILKTTYKDNKKLSPDYISTLENTIRTNPTYYKIYALGEFCSLDRLVYPNYKVESFDYHTIKGPLLIGLDFGFANDPSALVASILDETNRKLYIFKEWGDTGKTNPELARIITSLGFSKSLIIADSAEPKSVEELRRAGIYRIRPSVKGPDSIIHGIQKIQQYEIIVHPDCEKTITEFENYTWKKDKKTGEYTNEPNDEFNHFMDALRYSMQCINTDKLKIIDKSVLGIW